MYDYSNFTIADGLEHQKSQLANWKTKLNDACYKALAAKCAEMNAKGYSSPMYVFRGTDLDNFVANWKPVKK